MSMYIIQTHTEVHIHAQIVYLPYIVRVIVWVLSLHTHTHTCTHTLTRAHTEGHARTRTHTQTYNGPAEVLLSVLGHLRL